jgi:hypothetical protein
VAATLSPTLNPRQARPAVGPQDKEEWSSYILFGVLLAVLLGVVVVVAQRKR